MLNQNSHRNLSLVPTDLRLGFYLYYCTCFGVAGHSVWSSCSCGRTNVVRYCICDLSALIFHWINTKLYTFKLRKDGHESWYRLIQFWHYLQLLFHTQALPQPGFSVAFTLPVNTWHCVLGSCRVTSDECVCKAHYETDPGWKGRGGYVFTIHKTDRYAGSGIPHRHPSRHQSSTLSFDLSCPALDLWAAGPVMYCVTPLPTHSFTEQCHKDRDNCSSMIPALPALSLSH